MDSNDMRLLMRDVLMPICEDSSWPWNDQRNVMGMSPSETPHCTATGSPEVTGSSSMENSNGTMRGTTVSLHSTHKWDLKRRKNGTKATRLTVETPTMTAPSGGSFWY